MPADSEPPRFRGFYNPRTTPVPDNFFDEVLPDLSGAEVKVLLYVFRRTFGFKRDSDNISLSQMVSGITKRDGTVLDRGTGLSKSTAAEALRTLVAKGMLRKTRRNDAQHGHQATTYEPILTDETLLSENRTRVVRESDKPLSDYRTHKIQVNNKQSDNTVPNGGHSPLKELPNIVQEPERRQLLIEDVLAELGDDTSAAFYRLVAAKVPEEVIRRTLAEIRADGARDPRKLFTYRMHQWALKKLKQRIG
ncbi:MAG: replication protein [Planctomycetales bacterium]